MTMSRRLALVIAADGSTTPELDRTVSEAGFVVHHAAFREVLFSLTSVPSAELVLVSATFGLQEIRLLERHMQGDEGGPATLVFPQGDGAALEACVRGGFDFIMPPYLPGLLLRRLDSCSERTKLAGVVEELTASVRLREYERELSIARDIQSGFLPQKLPDLPGWEFSARFRPAREVGGDFYDGFELAEDGRIVLVIADVCDKGVGSALFMALIRTLLRRGAEQACEPLAPARPYFASWAHENGITEALLSREARVLVEAVIGANIYVAKHHHQQGYFATLFFGVLDPVAGRLLYINGGHNPPIILRADGRQTHLPPTGPAIGLEETSEFDVGRAVLNRGDTLLAYTDGVTDARSPSGEFYTARRLYAQFSRPAESAWRQLDEIDESLRDHVGTADQFDDITMLALRRDRVRDQV